MKRGQTYHGKPCIHGHGTWRYVANGRCVRCAQIDDRARFLATYVPKTARRRRVSIDGERE